MIKAHKNFTGIFLSFLESFQWYICSFLFLQQLTLTYSEICFKKRSLKGLNMLMPEIKKIIPIIIRNFLILSNNVI